MNSNSVLSKFEKWYDDDHGSPRAAALRVILLAITAAGVLMINIAAPLLALRVVYQYDESLWTEMSNTLYYYGI
mgnify:FL=1